MGTAEEEGGGRPSGWYSAVQEEGAMIRGVQISDGLTIGGVVSFGACRGVHLEIPKSAMGLH